MENENQSIVIFECCRFVKGSFRSVVFDLQRNTNRYIPNDLFELLMKYNKQKVSHIKSSYNNEFDDVIEENIDMLIEEGYLFYTDTPECFPAMNMQWDEPSLITNGIFEINENLISKSNEIWLQFSDVGCEHIEVRSYKKIGFELIKKLVDGIGTKRIISIDLILHKFDDIDDEGLVKLVHDYPRINFILLHTASESKEVFNSPTGMGHINKTTSKISSNQHCGVVSENSFVLNIKSFTESLHHNSCLNRKISIDANGNIKNCPSMSESFGNIKDTTLAEAIEKPDFKKYWNITKDEISKCKDCEFRYICTDCRAYTTDPNDMYSDPLKCGYDPYKGEWEEWSDNPLKQKAIDFYGMREMVNTEKPSQ